jgi:hypothetical protein
MRPLSFSTTSFLRLSSAYSCSAFSNICITFLLTRLARVSMVAEAASYSANTCRQPEQQQEQERHRKRSDVGSAGSRQVVGE